MDIETLKLLLEVSRSRSLAAVARTRNVDPSSVSRIVTQAEHELGFRLFHRTTRRLSLTEQGEQFLSRMSGVVEEFERACDEGRGASARLFGTVKVTASIAFGTTVLVPLLGRFRKKYPDLNMELMLSDQVVDLVENGIDLALRLGPSLTGDLVCVKLMDTRYRVCASPGYIERMGRPRTPEDLAKHRCLLFSIDPFNRRWLFRERQRHAREVPVRGDIIASSALALRTAAIHDLGPTLLADWLIDNDLSQGRLIDLFPNHAVTATSFDTAAWLVYPSRTFLPARVRATIDYLREHIPIAPASLR